MSGSVAMPCRSFRIPLLMVLLTALAGCVGSTTGQMIPVDRIDAPAATYYVERHEKDGRDFAAVIAEKFRSRGFSASSGNSHQRPPDAAYIVSYVDRWSWDMRMYLADLRIEVRDSDDSSLIGFGQSSQSSLKAMGKTHDNVIDAALDQLLGTSEPAGQD